MPTKSNPHKIVDNHHTISWYCTSDLAGLTDYCTKFWPAAKRGEGNGYPRVALGLPTVNIAKEMSSLICEQTFYSLKDL